MANRGAWQVGGAQQRVGCFAVACTAALALARRTQKPVLVRYFGPRQKTNRDPKRSDFRVSPDGRRDFTVDKTWWTHEVKKRG